MHDGTHHQTVRTPHPFTLYGETFSSRLLLGTGLYVTPEVMAEAIGAAGAHVVTVSLRREGGQAGSGARFWELIKALGPRVLPNTAGCHTAKEAVMTARMARDVFDTDWIKLEVIANDDTLHPDVFGLLEAARELTKDGFKVFPYCTDDLSLAERLVAVGCEVLMPWAAPIGSGRGVLNPYGLRSLRAYFPDTVLIVDAGLGAPSHAAFVMELGFDGVLLNTAVAKAASPPAMALAFAKAVESGALAYAAGLMPPRDMASPSTPVLGLASFDAGHAS